MRPVQRGDRVQVVYTGWLGDGTVVDSSIYSCLLVFTAGEGTVMPGLDQLVIGMSPGESKTEMIPSELAFGPYRHELSRRVAKAWVQAQDVKPMVGPGLEIHGTNRELVRMMITEATDDRVTLDANHYLAGKDLVLHVELLAILDQGMEDPPLTGVARAKGLGWRSSC